MKKLFFVALASAGLIAGCAQVQQQRGSSAPELSNTVKPTESELLVSFAKAATELAAGWFQQGQFGTALEELENATRVLPTYAPAYGMYGLVHHALKEDGKAETYFQKALAISPDNGELRNNYGWFLCRTSREAESVEQFEKAAADPLYRTPDLALQYAAQCATRIGKMQIAEGAYRRILLNDRESLVANLGLAEVTYRVGRFGDARNFVRSVMNAPQVAASTLYLGVCIETRMGDRNAANSYVAQLKNRYPNAVETARAQNGDCD
jgi:type IV pilus assembly protein PilF